MELENLIFEKAPIAMVTVNRPKALNALNVRVVEELAQVLRDVRHDSAVRALIITGAGDRAFVAGADIAAMSEMSAVQGLSSAVWAIACCNRWKSYRSRLSRRSMVSRWAGDWSWRWRAT